jgi:hypothetical protein
VTSARYYETTASVTTSRIIDRCIWNA